MVRAFIFIARRLRSANYFLSLCLQKPWIICNKPDHKKIPYSFRGETQFPPPPPPPPISPSDAQIEYWYIDSYCRYMCLLLKGVYRVSAKFLRSGSWPRLPLLLVTLTLLLVRSRSPWQTFIWLATIRCSYHAPVECKTAFRVQYTNVPCMMQWNGGQFLLCCLSLASSHISCVSVLVSPSRMYQHPPAS